MILLLSSILVLSFISYQDFKHKEVSLIFIFILFGLFCTVAYEAEGSFKAVGLNFLLNACFVIFQLICVKLYFVIKNKKNELFLDVYIGKGDILFFFISCMAFSTPLFIVFYFVSLIIALICAFIFYIGSANLNSKEVPLAGIMSVILVIIITYKLLFKPVNLYDDVALFRILLINL